LAAVVDSGPVSIAIPDNIDGVYLNLVTGQSGAAAPAGWDINPYTAAAGQFNLWGVNTNVWFAPSGVVAGPYPLATGTVVQGAAAAFFRPGGGTNVGTQVTLNSDQNYFGVRFPNEGNGGLFHFGYIQVSFGATAATRTIVRYAYENVAETAITIPTGATAPTFNYTPAAGGTVGFTGGAAVGSTGNGSVAVAIGTAGSGTGAAATTTTTCTAPTAPFAGFGQTVTAVGNGAISGAPLSGTCTLGAAVATQTLTCSQNRGGAVTPVTFTLSCPAGTQPPLTSTPVSGSTVALPSRGLGSAATTSSIAFQNPGAAAATVTCTAPTNTAFTAAPLSINVPAAGSASTTISYTSASVGTSTGSITCTVGAQTFTYNLTGTTLLPAPAVIPASNAWVLALLASLMTLLAGVMIHRRQG